MGLFDWLIREQKLIIQKGRPSLLLQIEGGTQGVGYAIFKLDSCINEVGAIATKNTQSLVIEFNATQVFFIPIPDLEAEIIVVVRSRILNP